MFVNVYYTFIYIISFLIFDLVYLSYYDGFLESLNVFIYISLFSFITYRIFILILLLLIINIIETINLFYKIKKIILIEILIISIVFLIYGILSKNIFFIIPVITMSMFIFCIKHIKHFLLKVINSFALHISS